MPESFWNINLFSIFDDYPQLADRIGRPADVFYHFAWKGVFGEAFQDYRLQLLNASYACQAAECAAQLGCKKYVLRFANAVKRFRNIINIDHIV